MMCEEKDIPDREVEIEVLKRESVQMATFLQCGQALPASWSQTMDFFSRLFNICSLFYKSTLLVH